MSSLDNLHIEPFDKGQHYKEICSWWLGHKWPCIPLESLSQTGMVAFIDGRPICAVWLYKTDSNLCWMEWMISNPSSSKKEREIALPALISHCALKAMHLGFKHIFTSTRVQRYIKRLQLAGFIVNDAGMTNLTLTV